MLSRNGCRVIAVDIDPENLKVAGKYGAEVVHVTSKNGIEAQVEAPKLDSGIDAALITAAAKNDSIVKNCCFSS